MKKRTKTAHVKIATNGQFYAVLKGRNYEPLADTETQTRKATLKRTLKRNFPDFVIVDQSK